MAADMGFADVGTAVGGADVGIVACAAGPSAAERGVAGSGDVRGEGPCMRSKPGTADRSGGSADRGCTAGADDMADGDVCMRSNCGCWGAVDKLKFSLTG